jgi:hypothetical protein
MDDVEQLEEFIERLGIVDTVHALIVYASEKAEAEDDEDLADAWEELADTLQDAERLAGEL